MEQKKKRNFRQWPLYIMIIPGLVYLIINNYIPITGLFIAFKDIDYSKGIFGSDWIGLKNFKYLFATQDAFVITRNTILYNIAFIIIGMIMGVIVGIMLSEIVNRHMAKIYQTVLLLPQLISMVIVAYIGFAFLSSSSGFINNSILPIFGADPISWYSETKYWPLILIFVNVWKGLGYSSIIYLSAVLGIDRSFYEAAEIDGAGKLKQIWYITLPLLKPTMITLGLMQVGRIFYSDFGLFYQLPMNQGALFGVTNTIDTYVYRALLENNDIAMSSAAGLYQSLVGFIVVVTVNAIVRKVDKENALF